MIPNGYTILPAEPAHLGRLADIERRAVVRFGSSVPPRVKALVTPPHVLEDAQRTGRLWVAAAADGELVGFALAEVSAGRAHLGELDVLPEHGRRGLGAALVSAVEHWALAQGLTELTLTTYVDIPWNADYYSKLGFNPIAEGDLDAQMLRHLADEDALGLERARRIAMLKRLTDVQ